MAGINSETFHHFDPTRVPSPCFVVDEVAVRRNLQILHRVQRESGAKVLAALKAFSMWSLAPLVSEYLSGTCASGVHEAKLSAEYYGDTPSFENHVYSAAFTQADLETLLPLANHIVFNSFSQWQRFKPFLESKGSIYPELQFGLRINPEHSEGATSIYNPCAPGSRLGIPIDQFTGQDLTGISGLHFHTLCEQGFEPLARTVAVVEDKFAELLPHMQWLNLGGGHLISHPDYDVDALVSLIKALRERYSLEVYIEPGEAVAIRSGVLVSEVLDIAMTDRQQAILDTSATCHMPDTLEMPYRADILGAGTAAEYAYQYRLGGMTCLAGDVIGDYSFAEPLAVGQRLMFDDMAHYTMVKTNTFNGIPLPAIAIWNSETDALRLVREFGYHDFKSRLS